MSPPRSEIGGVKQDLLVAVVALWLIFSVVYTFGRLFLPTHSVLRFLATSDVAPPGSHDSLLLELRADLLALHSPGAITQAGAIAQVSGAVEDRLLLDQVDGMSAGGGFEGEPIHLSVTYRGNHGVVLVSATDVAVGVPTSGRVTATLSTDGKTFIAHEGECVLELTRFESEPGHPIPRFDGQMSCTDVSELRTDATASFTVVFDFLVNI